MKKWIKEKYEDGFTLFEMAVTLVCCVVSLYIVAVITSI